jgi:hypothetical protein
MVRASTLLAPSQELAARAQPMSRPFSFLLFFSFDFAFSATFHAFSRILITRVQGGLSARSRAFPSAGIAAGRNFSLRRT